MNKLIDRLSDLARRKERFTYDLRGNCQVYSGIVSSYRAAPDSLHFTDLPMVILHALEHDGVVGAWKDPRDGRIYYDSCRLFTDVGNAFFFARMEGQRSVYNLNREEELFVDAQPVAA
jgi:hypothetical protein